MLATLGDLVDDVVVRLGGPVEHATDTPASISHRQGGSAATVARIAAGLGRPARFIGQVGDDPVGRALVAEITAAGVDARHVRFGRTTGTIVVLVDESGERSMLSDRGACVDLDRPDPSWLDGISALHLPLYSLVGGAIADTSRTVIEWAHSRGVRVSIDVSSTALIRSIGVGSARRMVTDLGPTVVFANRDEAAVLSLTTAIGDAITVVKRGGGPATIHRPDTTPIDIPAEVVDDVADTTGAGDAFAAGFLTTDDWPTDPLTACTTAHLAAAEHLRQRTAQSSDGR